MVPFWREAVKALNKEDHYILVMLDLPRPPADFAKLVITGLAIVGLSLAAVAAIQWVNQSIHFKIPDSIKLLAFIIICVLAYYLAYSDKGKELGEYVNHLAKRLGRWF